MKDIILDPETQPIDYATVDISLWKRVHFIGIGGAGMSVLAEMLIESGVEVSGSDSHLNGKTEHLASLGAHIYEGQSAQHVEGASIVVYSSAIKPDNPEIIRAYELGIVVMHRSDILATLMASHTAITVAGAHGKTTTSAMIAQIFTSAGEGKLADPSYAIGGSIHTAEGMRDGGHAGRGDIFIAEADESDGSFLKYRPNIAVITNVEPDHLDHYGSKDAFINAFVDYAHHCVDHIVACADDDGCMQVIHAMDAHKRHDAIVYTTDMNMQIQEGQIVYIHSDNALTHDGGQDFSLVWPQRYGQQRIHAHVRVPGIHNIRNATAALVSAIVMGIDPDKAVEGLQDFHGAVRRFDIRGTIHGVTVVDDYAHHPTEVEALLSAARVRYPHQRIRVLFQPHLYSRTHFFAREFAQALSQADQTVICGIYPAREFQKDWPNINAQTIVLSAEDNNITADMRAIEDMKTAADYLADTADSGDVIFTVGAGSITSMGQEIIERLEKRTHCA